MKKNSTSSRLTSPFEGLAADHAGTVAGSIAPAPLVRDPLTDILRKGAVDLLARAVEAEVACWIDDHASVVDERGRRQVVRRLIQPVIPQRSDQIEREGRRRFDAMTYKRRSVIEQSVGWLKENRRVGTRYDKLAVNFAAFVNLAIIRRYLRLLDPSDTA